MAIIDKKQKQWYAESTFESLDKTTIPIGTEIQVSGKLGQGDFDDDTNTKLNAVGGKLNAPTDEILVDSIPVISSTGTVSAQPYTKFYKHIIRIRDSGSDGSITQEFYIYAISRKSDEYTLDDLDIASVNDVLECSMIRFSKPINSEYMGMFFSYSSDSKKMTVVLPSGSTTIQLSDNASAIDTISIDF